MDQNKLTLNDITIEFKQKQIIIDNLEAEKATLAQSNGQLRDHN